MSYLVLYIWPGVMFFSPVLIEYAAKKNFSYPKAILWTLFLNLIPPLMVFLYNKEVFFMIKNLVFICGIISPIIWLLGFKQIKNRKY